MTGEVSSCSDYGIFDGFKMSPHELENIVFYFLQNYCGKSIGRFCDDFEAFI
jgi:hypothetical protein